MTIEIPVKERSPLKDRSLRVPGQSCEEQRRKLFEDKVEGPIYVASAMGVFAFVQFGQKYWNAPQIPEIWAAFAFGSVAFALYRVKSFLPQSRNLKLAAEGERAVGQYLERLRLQGYEVFHDVPGLNFNVDHVLIGPAGIFTIETKTWTKPKSGNPQISFDGSTLLKGGLKPERDPIVQAKAQATWVARLVEEGTGWKLPVRPVVLFPGWFVEQTHESKREIWILEPKALGSFLEHDRSRLEPEQIKLAAYHLSRYVRTFEQPN